MSDELKNKLTVVQKENEDLKTQAANNTQGIEALLAQIDAHRSQMNESLNAGLQLRTQLILVNRKLETTAKYAKELQDQVDKLTKLLEEANMRIADLSSNQAVNG